MALASALSAAIALAATQPAAYPPPDRLASEIAQFDAVDASSQPLCPVLFVGSSSIRLWTDLQTDMAPYPVLNRGFGGSTIHDINAYFDLLVARHRPRAIFFYAGENDVDFGVTPAAVVQEFEAFMRHKREALGRTPVYFVSLKPSPARLIQLERQRQVNAAIARQARAQSDLHYVDVASPMLDQGRPRPIYLQDNLHMSRAGYAIWIRRLRPLVAREAGRSCLAAR